MKNATLSFYGYQNQLIPFLTHSFLTGEQLFSRIFKFFYAIFIFSRPEHDCYAKFTSFSTHRNIKTTLKIKYQFYI